MSITNVRTIIEEMLKKMGISYDAVEMQDGGNLPGAKFLVKTNDSGILIGNKGETLTALNFLVRRIIEKQFPGEDNQYHFFIDVNDYQTMRIKEIHKLADMFAGRARSFKHKAEMPPASSYERMVVHAYFAETPDITTESAGIGKDRHVVLAYTEGEEHKEEF